MEKCYEESKINNASYQRIRNLACQLIDPYKKDIINTPNYFKIIIFFLLAVLFIFYHLFSYQNGAINLSK